MGNFKNITIIDMTGLSFEFPPLFIFLVCGFAIAISLAFYLLRSIGLFTMAKKENLKCAYVAFIPIAWIYVATKLSGTITFFGKKFKNFAYVALAIMLVADLTFIFVNCVIYVPVIGYYLQGGEVAIAVPGEGLPGNFVEYGITSGIYLGNNFLNPYVEMGWIIKVASICSVIYRIFEIVQIILLVMIYIGLFRSYMPEHNFIGSMLSVLGFFPIMVFIVRNKKPVNFEEYIRAKFYGMHASRPNQNGAQGSSMNGEGRNDTPPKRPENDDPFPEFNQKSEKDD